MARVIINDSGEQELFTDANPGVVELAAGAAVIGTVTLGAGTAAIGTVDTNLQVGDVDASTANPVPTSGCLDLIEVTLSLSTDAYASGDVLATACKFPDTFSVIVTHFGPSDYGYDNPDGWWYNNDGSDTAEIQARVGGTPAAVPNNYRARNAVEAIAHNYTGGHLYLFHDDADTRIPIVHSQRIGAAILPEGLGNYTEDYTDALDDPRWTHGYPTDGSDLVETEPIWVPTVWSQTAWIVPASGTVCVIGYIVTKRFEIWLGTTTRGGVGGGLDEVATVVYDTTIDTYTVTPLTGACDVYVWQADGKTGTAVGIVVETEIIVT